MTIKSITNEQQVAGKRNSNHYVSHFRKDKWAARQLVRILVDKFQKQMKLNPTFSLDL